MPRIRTLKPEHRQHRKVGKLSHVTYRLWVGMILEADDEGRLICDPDQLRVIVFGYHPKVTTPIVTSSLRELESAGLIRLYTVDGIDYAAFLSWHDHQKIDHPKQSTLPEPSGDPRDVNLAKYAETVDSPNPREASRILANIRGGKEVEVEGKGSGRERSVAPAGANAPTLTPPSPDTTTSNGWHTPSAIVQALARCPKLGAVARLHEPALWRAEIRANPGVDLARELLKAEAYLTAHPDKHYKRLTEFLHRWFGRADRPVEA